MIARRSTDQSGQGLVEYALILALVVVASVLVLSVMGVSVQDVYHSIVDSLFGGDDSLESCYSSDFDGKPDDWSTGKWGFFRGGWTTKEGKLVSDPAAVTFLVGFLLLLSSVIRRSPSPEPAVG